jgi:hypothetical protein
MRSSQLHRQPAVFATANLAAALARVALAATALAVLGPAAAAPAGAQTLNASPWSLDIGAVAGFPAAPAPFQDNWNSAWGLEGGLRRRFGSRIEWGLRAQFVQFRLGDIPGEEVLGGARSVGRIASPVALRVWSSSSNTVIVIDGDAGYVHQSIEQVSHALHPPKPGPADGFSAACGVEWRRRLYAATDLVLGVRHTWAFLPDETARYTTLLLGARAPVGARR